MLISEKERHWQFSGQKSYASYNSNWQFCNKQIFPAFEMATKTFQMLFKILKSSQNYLYLP